MPGAPHTIAIGFNSMGGSHRSEETVVVPQEHQIGWDQKHAPPERSVSLLSSMLLMRTSSLLRYAMSSGDFSADVPRSLMSTGDSLNCDNAEGEGFELAGGPASSTSIESSFSSRVSSPIPIPELT